MLNSAEVKASGSEQQEDEEMSVADQPTESLEEMYGRHLLERLQAAKSQEEGK